MPELAFDFVYTPEDEFNFINLRITLSVIESGTTHQYQLLLETEDDIANKDIIDIFSELNKKKFARMKVDVATDCKVLLSVAGNVREIDLARIKADA